MELSNGAQAIKSVRRGQGGVVLFEITVVFLGLLVPVFYETRIRFPKYRQEFRELSRERITYDGVKQWESLIVYMPGGREGRGR